MVPGRKYTVDSVLRLLWRRKLVIVLLGILGGSAAAAYVWPIPDVYRSEATLLVRAQVVPQAFVRSTVTSDIDDLVRVLAERVLAADSLSAIISELNLGPGASRPSPQLLAATRQRVALDIVRADAFSVGFHDRNPVVAARVTARLARAFIDENLRSRTGLAEETDQFLDEQLRATRDRLNEQLKNLENYRRTYAGQLPTQLDANLQVLSSAQEQLQAADDAIQADIDRKLRLEQSLGTLTEEASSLSPAVEKEPEAPVDPLGDEVLRLRGRDALRQLPGLRRALQQLELQFKAQHPDVVRLKAVIATLENRVTTDLGPAALLPPPDPGVVERRRNADAMRAEIRAIDGRLTERRKDEAQLRNTLTIYRHRVEAIPTRETELTALMRDYETVRESYQSLLKKREEAQLAAELERRRVGETLYVGLRPTVPTRPYAPRRQRSIAMGAFAGLLLGLLIVGWREFRDQTLRTEAEVVFGLELPVLAVVPAMAQPAVARSQWARAGASIAGLVVIGMAVAFYMGLWPRL